MSTIFEKLYPNGSLMLDSERPKYWNKMITKFRTCSTCSKPLPDGDMLCEYCGVQTGCGYHPEKINGEWEPVLNTPEWLKSVNDRSDQAILESRIGKTDEQITKSRMTTHPEEKSLQKMLDSLPGTYQEKYDTYCRVFTNGTWTIRKK